jgi:hypothetical protein
MIQLLLDHKVFNYHFYITIKVIIRSHSFKLSPSMAMLIWKDTKFSIKIELTSD